MALAGGTETQQRRRRRRERMARADDPRLGTLVASLAEAEVIKADPLDMRTGIGVICFPHDEGTRRNCAWPRWF